jgi:hypothetical protein
VARYRFPSDRSAFIYGDDFAPVLIPPRTALVIYTDQAKTTLADVRDLSNVVLPGSTVYIEHGQIPEFLGPNLIPRLWGSVGGAAAYPLDAQVVSLLAEIGSTKSFVFTQPIAQSVWSVPHGLGGYPAAVSVFSTDWGTQFDEFSVHHVDEDNLLISMDIPTPGVAVIR